METSPIVCFGRPQGTHPRPRHGLRQWTVGQFLALIGTARPAATVLAAGVLKPKSSNAPQGRRGGMKAAVAELTDGAIVQVPPSSKPWTNQRHNRMRQRDAYVDLSPRRPILGVAAILEAACRPLPRLQTL